jgi:hypothetical protein
VGEIDIQAVTMALAEEFAARGVDASYEYGEVVLIPLGDDRHLLIGTANAPRWGWTLYDNTDGDTINSGDAAVEMDAPAHIVADAITASLWATTKIDLRAR